MQCTWRKAAICWSEGTALTKQNQSVPQLIAYFLFTGSRPTRTTKCALKDKQSWHAADHAPASNPEFKNKWRSNSSQLYAFMARTRISLLSVIKQRIFFKSQKIRNVSHFQGKKNVICMIQLCVKNTIHCLIPPQPTSRYCLQLQILYSLYREMLLAWHIHCWNRDKSFWETFSKRYLNLPFCACIYGYNSFLMTERNAWLSTAARLFQEEFYGKHVLITLRKRTRLFEMGHCENVYGCSKWDNAKTYTVIRNGTLRKRIRLFEMGQCENAHGYSKWDTVKTYTVTRNGPLASQEPSSTLHSRCECNVGPNIAGVTCNSRGIVSNFARICKPVQKY